MIEKIKELMSKHDWYFDFADDNREWSKGFTEKREIISLMRQIPASELPGLLELVPKDLRLVWALDLQMLRDKQLIGEEE